MRVMFLNFEFGLAATKGFRQMLYYRRYFSYPKIISRLNDFIEKENIDVIGLVEVNFPRQADNFKKITGFNCVGEPIHKNMFINQGNLFLSRYPIVDSEVIKLPHQGQKRGVLRAKIKTSSSPIQFFITHLGLRKKERFEQIKLLNEICSEIGAPFIVMGDFNCSDWRKELEPLLGNPRLKHIDLEPTYPSWKPRKCFDHVFISKDLTAKAKVYGEEKFSDHLAIVSEIDYV